MFAVYHNNDCIVELLLRNGAETLYRDLKGRTVIHYAIKYQCSKTILKLLVDYNAILDREKGHIKENNIPEKFQDSF
jgi:ankyrin repeat protein